jgi:type IV pilus assembly protein PilP
MIRTRVIRGAVPAVAACAVLLSGCDDGRRDLQSWMEETRRNTPLVRETVSEPKAFTPYRYAAAGEVEPFSLAKLKIDLSLPPPGRSNALMPDLQRPREALEAYPLDVMKMVGNLRQGPSTVALLQIESQVHQVRVGNYLGQNFGRVVRISDGELGLKERVQDAAGDWVERDTSLRLQEGKR